MTCLLCADSLDGDRPIRPSSDGFVHIDCAETRLFVYGTLRTGGRLEGWLPSRLFRERAVLHGYALHYGEAHRAYPYLVRTGDDGDVVAGEVVTVPLDDAEAVQAAIDTARMEQNAGYEIDAVAVTLKSGAAVGADAFVWPYRVGERVESGDWTATPEWQLDAEPVAPEAQNEHADWDVALTHDAGALVIVDRDDRELWRGYSYTRLTAWLDAEGLKLA